MKAGGKCVCVCVGHVQGTSDIDGHRACGGGGGGGGDVYWEGGGDVTATEIG